MMDDVKEGVINCIIVKDLSRFGRDYIGVGDYQENILPRYNVRFIAVNDHIDTANSTDGSDSIVIPFKNILNEQYARDISRKVRSALDTKRRRGEFIGAFACYGYKKDPENRNRILIDEEAAQTVRKIFEWYIAGTPKLSIALKLNEMQIPCPSEYKKQNGQNYVNANRLPRTCYWTHTTIHRILNNEMYIGNMVQHKQSIKGLKQKKNVQLDRAQWMIVPGTHEPVIDTQTWKIAQRLLHADIKKSQYTGEIHLFAGIIRCGDCARAMKKRMNGKIVYYICGTYMLYGNKICSSHSIRLDYLSDAVFTELKAQMNKYVDYGKISSDLYEQNKENAALQSIKNKIAGLERKAENILVLRRGLYEDLKRGILSEAEYARFKKDYEMQTAKVDTALAQLRKKLADCSSADDFGRSSERILQFKEAAELTRELLVSLVKSIAVFQDNSLVIDFNFTPL